MEPLPKISPLVCRTMKLISVKSSDRLKPPRYTILFVSCLTDTTPTLGTVAFVYPVVSASGSVSPGLCTEILVLDEATSALDEATEAAVMDAIHTQFEGITILMIAHRLTTLERCDRLIQIEHGKIIDVGDQKAIDKLVT